MERPSRGAAIALLVLGILAVWSRLWSLDQSLWHDEALTVLLYVSKGPAEILVGTYTPNDHILFELLAWATVTVFGTSEVTLRLWSVLPALGSIAVAGGWAWRRLGPWWSVAIVWALTTSPVHLSLSRQARGYGLAFLAMSALLVSGDAFQQDPSRTRALWLFAGAGLLGTLTLPVFVLPVGAAAVALAATTPRRAAVVFATGVVAVLTLVWYLPSLTELVMASSQRFGAPLPWHGVLSSPVNHLVGQTWRLVPHGLPSEVTWILTVTAFTTGGVVLCRRSDVRLTALIAATLFVTPLALSVLGWWVSARFVSYLLLPAWTLVLAGPVGLLETGKRRVLRRLGQAAVATLAVAVLVGFVRTTTRHLSIPAEALRDAAMAATSSGVDRIVTNSRRPVGLQHYLGSRLEVLDRDGLLAVVCGEEPVVFIDHPARGAVELPEDCLAHADQHLRFEQRTRGGSIELFVFDRR